VQREERRASLAVIAALTSARHRIATVKERLLKGWDANGRTYKVHLDGFNQLPYLTGGQPESALQGFFYFNDDGQLVAVRYGPWKQIFCEQRVEGTLQVWAEARLPAPPEAHQSTHGPL
jgi:hypothetical protein